MRGFVEALAEHEVRGWAFDEIAPNAHLTVSAWLDGRRLAQGKADGLRPDLRQAGIGGGDHEFRLPLSPAVPSADLARLVLQAERDQHSITLKSLPGSNQSRADKASESTVPFSDKTQFPVFVLGPARSGTSALALALLKSGGYEGHGEGHLLPLAHEMLRVVDTYYAERSSLEDADTFLRAVHYETFQRAVRRSFVQLTRAAFPSGHWVDKTPTAQMVRAAPLMLELWPNARFIFLKRRVVENIISRRRKFPQDTLENHYLDWVNVLSAWRDVCGQLGTAALEVDQMDMARNNDAFVEQVSTFLQMPPGQAETLRRTLALDHPEQTSLQVGLSASINGLNLSADDLRELMLACDPMMAAYGYCYGSEYYATSSQLFDPLAD